MRNWHSLRLPEEYPSSSDLILQLAEFAEDHIFIVDRRLLILYSNNCSTRLFGSPPEKAAGRPLNQLLPLEVYEIFKQKIDGVFHSGDPTSLESRIAASAGDMWMHTQFTPITDEAGEVTAALCIARDVTRKKKSEELIIRSKREWLQIIDAMPFLVAFIDNRYRIRKVNRPMAEKLGVSVQEAVGLICYEHLHGLKEPPRACPLHQATAEGNDRAAEMVEEHGGEPYFVRVASVHDQISESTGCVYIAQEACRRTEVDGENLRRVKSMRTAMTHADHLLFVQDEEGRYLFFQATPPYGIRPEEVVGKTPFDVFEPAMASRVMERLKRVVRGGQGAVRLYCAEGEEGEAARFSEETHLARDPAGKAMTVVTILRKIRSQEPAPCHLEPLDQKALTLSKRENEILGLIASGLSNRQIAEKLFISIKTVETHRSRIMRKLGVHKTSALVNYALKSGLL